MCGVLHDVDEVDVLDGGSSPHVRGFAMPVCPVCKEQGFIPACAGFCIATRRRGTWCRVHPRMCGVLISRAIKPPLSRGSSPHVRGFAWHTLVTSSAIWFIPACAGFCRRPARPGSRSRVHPRMCGVLPPTKVRAKSKIGSSPHVRGFGRRESHKSCF